MRILFIFVELSVIFSETFSQNCGKAKSGIGNVIGGAKVTPHQYPWVAALLINKGGSYRFHCGAVVIAKYQLLTAAHCIQDKGSRTKYLPRDIRAVIGVHDLNDQFEVGKEIRSIKSIFVHPDWNPDVISFDADIASIFLEKEIIFNNYIQPICLWESQTVPQVTSLLLIGYGKSEDQSKVHENIPKALILPMHSQEDCFLSNRGLVAISSKRTFCAGSADGTGACSGDSGSGLFIKISNVYFLRGIVSSSLIKDSSCDVNAYSVFTDVLKYKSWIKTLKVDAIETQLDASNNQCGIMSSSSGLIEKGSFATRKEFPWMAIIDGNFRTSGALISHKHVVSILSAVADWDKTKNKYVPPADVNRIKISLAAVRTDEENSIVLHPSKIVFHPEYKFADKLPVINIAVIILNNFLNFNDYVRPVCLWNLNNQEISNSPLYAVGYGNGATGEPTNARKYIKMSFVNQTECAAKFDGQKNFMQESKTFCAVGSADGYPCHQDESIFLKYNGRWYWRGFSVIRFFLTSNPNLCASTPILYEDAAKYTQWLRSFIEI